MTKYAKKIREIIEASRDHKTAEQIFEALKKTYPTVVRATVYNNLNKLWDAGMIRKISSEGLPDRYDRLERHDHLMCRKCGRLIDVDLGDLTQQLQQRLRVPILSYDLKLMYICEACRKKEQEEGREES